MSSAASLTGAVRVHLPVRIFPSFSPSALDDAEHALGLAVAGVPYIGWHLNVVLDGSIGQKRVAASIVLSSGRAVKMKTDESVREVLVAHVPIELLGNL
jgi:hypothetical protein